jgi:cytidylate kinase
MVVTVSNLYGAGAVGVARRAAEALSYLYVDRQLPVVVATRLRISQQEVEENEDVGRSLSERLLTGLERGTPELGEASTLPAFDRELVDAIGQAIREFADAGDCLIVGRGGAHILQDRTDVVSVFVHAPRAWRVARVAAASGAERNEVEAEVDRVDRMRAAYVNDWYRAKFGDPGNYDLCIDSSAFEEGHAAELIATAVRLRART